MATWKGIIGKSFSPEEFDDYCQTLHWTAWRPSMIVLHNMAIPSLVDRPNGLTQQHITNLESFYRDVNKWSAGPHLFIDDLQIWVFTPLTTPGVHSPSWNSVALGIEMLGDFSKDDFNSGRGLNVHHNAVAAIASLSAILSIDLNKSFKLHKEDPTTTHKDCPGKTVDKVNVISEAQALVATRHQGEHTVAG